MITVEIRSNRNILNNIIGRLDERSQKSTYDSVKMIQEYIDANWSAYSPSSAYNPPAVVTGTLKDSAEIKDISSGSRSAFSLKYTAPYADALEWGTMYMSPRPFLGPAFSWAENNLAEKFKTVFSDD